MGRLREGKASMATVAPGSTPVSDEMAERRTFFVLVGVMAATIVAGFSMNLAMGRSSFSAPWLVHAHGIVFMGWLALALAQAFTISTGRRALHIRLGKLAYLWIPAMVALGIAVMVNSARTRGGPFFFALNEFLVSNVSLLLGFAGVALWALRRRRHDGWHRRLMIVSMAMLTGPGIGRLLPMPLLIPWSWTIAFVVTLIFPAIAMAIDLRRHGRVHPAYKWGTGVFVAVFAASMLLAYSPIGYAITEAVVAGTPGAERPMAAFLPPGFTM